MAGNHIKIDWNSRLTSGVLIGVTVMHSVTVLAVFLFLFRGELTRVSIQDGSTQACFAKPQ